MLVFLPPKFFQKFATNAFCLFLLGFAFSGCGKEKFCIGPVGTNCNFGPTDQKSVANQSGGTVRFKPDEIREIKPGEAYTFQAIGGYPPYRYTIDSGGGTIDENTGEFKPPADNGAKVTIKVTDKSLDTKANYKLLPILVRNE